MHRIAYVFPQGDVGGAEIATVRWLTAHDGEYFEPMAILLRHGPLSDRLAKLGIQVEIAPVAPRLGERASRRRARHWIAERLQRHHITLQHSVMAWTHAIAGPAAQSVGIPEMWYQHTPPRLSNAIDWYAALTRTRHIFTNSEFSAELIQRLNVRRFPLTVVSPPVEVHLTRENSDSIRGELEADATTVLVVPPGRLQRTKGQSTAIGALASAIGRAPTLRLVIVGDEAFGIDEGYRNELHNLAEDLGVGAYVRFTGFRKNVAQLVGASDIVISPSIEPEGYGLAIAETLAVGRPVVASNLGATPELIQDGVNGILVPPGNVDRLADVLVELACDPAERTRLGRNASSTRLQTAQDGVRQLETEYLKILEA